MKALILAGGKSSRMGQDKASLILDGQTLLERARTLLAPLADEVYLSVAHDDERDHALPVIRDLEPSPGPLGGLQAAFQHDLESSWFLLACDLPRLSADDVAVLAEPFDGDVACFLNPLDGHPEPLCAHYAPSARVKLDQAIADGRRCARRFLASLERTEFHPHHPQALLNLNRPEHLAELEAQLAGGSAEKAVTVEYFAKLSQEAGCEREEIKTTAATLAGLWEEVRLRHQFTLDLPHIKAARDNEFVDWNTTLDAHDTIAFMPPFAGG